VQGLHKIKEGLSVEEAKQRSARSAKRVSFKEIHRSKIVEIPRMQGVHGRSKSYKESSSKWIARRNIQRELSYKDFTNYRSRYVQEGVGSFQIFGSGKSA